MRANTVDTPRDDRNLLPVPCVVLLPPPRCPSRRPASAPVRFFGRRSVSSPGYERTVGSELHDRHGGCGVPPRRATKRRPGSALAGNHTPQNQAQETQRYHLHDQRRDGSPLPPAAWGVRPTSASSVPAGPVVADCLEQTGRTYEEFVVCRGTQGVVKGSVTRHQKRQHSRSSTVPTNQRQQDEGLGGRDSKGLGLLEGTSEGLWVCGRRNEGGGGDDDVGDQDKLGLAINPSPWGAFVGGPPAEKTLLGRDRKRPSSAPRRPSAPSAATIPTQGLEVGRDHVQARSRSAHAASPSRNCATDVFVTTCYSSCDKEDRPSQKSVGAERVTQNSACRSSCGGRPGSAEVRVVELGEGTHGINTGRPRQADGKRLSTSSCQQRAAAPDVDLVVVARQVQVGAHDNFPVKEGGGGSKICEAHSLVSV